MSTFLGMGDEKKDNIGFIILIVAFFCWIALVFIGRNDTASNAFNIITLVIGYIFREQQQ